MGLPELPSFHGNHQARRWVYSERKPVKTTGTGDKFAEHTMEQSSETVAKFSCAKIPQSTSPCMAVRNLFPSAKFIKEVPKSNGRGRDPLVT